MNSERHRAILTHLIREFGEQSLAFPHTELELYVDLPGQAKPCVTRRDAFGDHGTTFWFWATDQSPRRYWCCQFIPLPSAHQDAHKAYKSYLNLAKQAGNVARDLPGVAIPGLTSDVRDDDLWTILLFLTAWQDLPGIPLNSICRRVEPRGNEVRTAPPAGLAAAVPGLRADLSRDPFAASKYVASVLLEGLPPLKESPAAPTREKRKRGKRGQTKDWEIRAAMQIREHPEWTDREIADDVQISASSLSRSEFFKRAKLMNQSAAPETRNVIRDEEGQILDFGETPGS